MDIKEYLEDKGITPHVQGNNLVFHCPFSDCGDGKQRCGININQDHKFYKHWNCFNCERKGRSLKTFQKALNKDLGEDGTVHDLNVGDPVESRENVEIDQAKAIRHHKLLKKKGRNAKKYLKEVRGFNKETIKHFMIGSYLKKGYEYVSLPFFEDSNLVNIKYRSINYKDRKFKWKRIKGGKSSLFHDEVLDDPKYSEIYFCEAELDAVALWNAGIKNVVAATTGAKKFQQEWYDRLEKYKKVYLVFDNDIDGQDGARKMAKRLGMERCYNVVLPYEDIVEGGKKAKLKDVNQYFWDNNKKQNRYERKDFKKLVKKAQQFHVPDVMTLRQAYEELIRTRFLADEDEIIGLQTPWAKVNQLIGGAKAGELVVVSARPKVGKTTFVMNWLMGLGEQGVKSYMECCEMKQLRIAEKTVAMHCADFVSNRDMTELQIREAKFYNPSDQIILGYPQSGAPTLEGMCTKIEEVVQRYGVQLVCFDNLHFLVRGDNVKDKIGEVTRRFKILAETLGITFVLITHPRKMSNPNAAPTADDLKDSSSIFQDLDTLIMLNRKPIKEDDNEVDDEGVSTQKLESMTTVDVSGRWTEGGRCLLHFKGNRSLFVDSGPSYERAKDKYLKRQKQKMKKFNKAA